MPGSNALRRILSPVLTLACVLAAGAQTDGVAPSDGPSVRPASNDITLIVDGQVRKVWTVKALMQGRFDWVSPQGAFSPAVPLTYALYSGDSGLDGEGIEALDIVTRQGTLHLDRGGLDMLERLLLRVDFTRDGAWQLVGADRDAEREVRRRAGKTRLSRVHRIEILGAELEDHSIGPVYPAASTSVSRPPERGRDSNDVAVYVNDTLTRTWSVREMMTGRFDWVSAQGRFSPAVPITYLLDIDEGELEASKVSSVSFVTSSSRLVLEKPDLQLIDNLVLRLDLTRDGTWQIVGRDKASDERIKILAGHRLFKLSRIDVTRTDSAIENAVR